MPATITGSQNGTVGLINAATAQNSTSGTALDFTGLPSGLRRITVMFNGVSTNGASLIIVQIGAGSFTTSGYIGSCTSVGAGAVTSITTGFGTISANAAADVRSGILQICLLGSNVWCSSSVMALSNAAANGFGAGAVSLAGTLDRVRITTISGTDTFDAGSVNILYE